MLKRILSAVAIIGSVFLLMSEQSMFIVTHAQNEVKNIAEADLINTLSASSSKKAISIDAPTAANVPIAGRITTNTGKAIVNAKVSLTDSTGRVRYTQSNAFGFYRFLEILSGSLYFISVRHKRYRFTSQAINLTEEAVEINFTPTNK